MSYPLSRPISSYARPRLALLVLLLALGACGSAQRDSASNGNAQVVRVPLEPAAAAPALPPPAILARYEVGSEPPPWKFRGADLAVRQMGKGAAKEYVLVVRTTDKKSECRFEMPGPFDPQAFNQVALEVNFPAEDTIQVLPLRDGKAIPGIAGSSKRVPPRHYTQTVVFDLPLLRRQEKPVEGLAIVFGNKDARSGVVSIELRHRPWSQWLPPVTGAAELVDIEGELRRAKVLSSALPLQADFELGGATDLEVSFGMPPQFREPGSAPVLVLQLSDAAGGELSKRYPLEARLDAPGRWELHHVSLAKLQAGPVRASFALESKSPEEIVCAVAEPRLVRRAKSAPTVIMITSDTHRADYLGTAGQGVAVRTPYLDELAQRGAYFTNCLAAANVTNPSHVALMTATSPRDTGVIANEKPLAPDVATLAEHFREAGYLTYAAVSAIHLAHRQSGLGQGFDRMSVPEDPQRDSSAALEHLKAWLGDAEGLPLFVWWHIFDAHAPYEERDPFHQDYWPSTRDPRDPNLPAPPEVAIEHWIKDVRDLEYVETLYRSEVSYVDAQVKRLLQAERMHTAWIVFTADHGESLGRHDIYWDHRELYPENLHVPLILVGPGIPAGLRCDKPVEQIDTGRTLLDLVGLQEQEFPGENLLRVARGELPQASVRYALSAHALSASIMTEEWFLVLHLRDHSFSPSQPARKLHEVELYNLSKDPHCEHNLVDEEQERAAQLRANLIVWLASAKLAATPSEAEAVDTEVINNLIELGYSGDASQISTQWIDPDCTCPQCEPYD